MLYVVHIKMYYDGNICLVKVIIIGKMAPERTKGSFFEFFFLKNLNHLKNLAGRRPLVLECEKVPYFLGDQEFLLPIMTLRWYFIILFHSPLRREQAFVGLHRETRMEDLN